jgi:hypothetical protein
MRESKVSEPIVAEARRRDIRLKSLEIEKSRNEKVSAFAALS